MSGIIGRSPDMKTGILGAPPRGSIVQKKHYASYSDWSSSSSTNINFGFTTPSGLMDAVQPGNHVEIASYSHCYTGGNIGGYIYMFRGVHSGNMNRSTGNGHAHNLGRVGTGTGQNNASEPHVYISSAGHWYSFQTMICLDRSLTPGNSLGDPRYSFALGRHPGSGSTANVTAAAGWAWPWCVTLTEYQVY